jgi:hypothetical protein
MTRRLVFNDGTVAQFVAQQAKCSWNPEYDHFIGVVDDSYESTNPAYPRGGVIYQSFTGASCIMHVAGRDERWLIPDMLATAFHFPFVQLGCAAVFGIVDGSNGLSRRFARRLGFREIATLPLMFAGSAGIVVTMTRAECRWLTLRLRTVQAGGGDGWQGG